MKNNKGGFSIVEVLVYLAVLVLAVSVMVTLFISLGTVLTRNQVEREMTHSAEVVLERIVRDIREATTADTTIANQLTLQTFGGATTTVISLSGSEVLLSVNGSNLGSLTDSKVEVDNLVFTKYETVGAELETILVRAALTLSVSNKVASSTHTYYTSAVLRGSYE